MVTAASEDWTCLGVLEGEDHDGERDRAALAAP
jgi:hypothetical protein